MKRLLITLLPLFLLAGCLTDNAPLQRGEDFNFDWKFMLGDEPAYAESAFDDGAWRDLHLPHDWSIEGEFSADMLSLKGDEKALFSGKALAVVRSLRGQSGIATLSVSSPYATVRTNIVTK